MPITRYATSLVLLVLCLAAFGQARQRADELLASPNYLCGQGWAETYASADKAALADLASKISVHLESSFEVKEEELVGGDGTFNSLSAARSVVNTYASASLTGTDNIVVEQEPHCHVVRYIRKSELSRIFGARRLKVEDFVRSADQAEERGKIDDALRYYYWAYTLLRSMQKPDTVQMDGGRRLVTWLPHRIEEVLSGLNARVAGVHGQDVDIAVDYKGKPVASVDYTYFDGQRWSNIYSAKDGMGVVELAPGASAGSLQLKYEYEYAGQASIDKELETTMAIFKGTAFRKATTVLGTKPAGEAKAAFRKAVAAESGAHLTKVANAGPYNAIVERIVKAIGKREYTGLDDCFTPEGWQMFDRLVHYGKARLLGSPSYSFYEFGGRTVCRGIPMSFTFPDNNRTFVETVTLTFSAEGKIETVAFALGEEARRDIFLKSAWSENARMTIATFLENYKTAYALKRLDYIESIFDDNAIIIIGSMPPKKKTVEHQPQIDNKMVRYTRQSKDQYVRNLRKCFARNNFVNIRFADNDVTKMGRGGETYGIQIKQDYYSEHYGDHGYLFLMVDLNNPDEPNITVRTWQPDRDPNINSTLSRASRDWGLIGPGNFD